MPKAAARLTTSLPIRPRPITPSVLPNSSDPVCRFHSPAFTARMWNQKFLATAIISPIVCSATVVSFTPGVNSTGIRLAVACFTSIESRPMPYLAMTFSRFGRSRAASITRAVIRSSPLSRPSNPPSCATSSSICCSESGPRALTTSKPEWFSTSWCRPGVSWKLVVERRIRMLEG